MHDRDVDVSRFEGPYWWMWLRAGVLLWRLGRGKSVTTSRKMRQFLIWSQGITLQGEGMFSPELVLGVANFSSAELEALAGQWRCWSGAVRVVGHQQCLLASRMRVLADLQETGAYSLGLCISQMRKEGKDAHEADLAYLLGDTVAMGLAYGQVSGEGWDVLAERIVELNGDSALLGVEVLTGRCGGGRLMLGEVGAVLEAVERCWAVS